MTLGAASSPLGLTDEIGSLARSPPGRPIVATLSTSAHSRRSRFWTDSRK